MGFPVVAPMAVVSIVVAFLTLDRILVLKLLQNYSPRQRKRLFNVFLVVTSVYSIGHYINYLNALKYMPPKAGVFMKILVESFSPKTQKEKKSE